MRIKVFGNLTPTKPATARVITTGSQMRPRKALGNPRRLDCQETPTFPQEMTAFILQARLELGFLASAIASMERTREAVRLAMDDTSIVIKVPRCFTSRGAVSIWLTGSSIRSLIPSVSLPGSDESQRVRLCDEN